MSCSYDRYSKWNSLKFQYKFMISSNKFKSNHTQSIQVECLNHIQAHQINLTNYLTVRGHSKNSIQYNYTQMIELPQYK